jgi:hypothetical protein
MSQVLIGFLMIGAVTMAILVFLIVVLSAALLIFARGEKKAKQSVGTLMEPKKSPN